MTVPTTTNKVIGEGNGVSTVFPFTFGTLPSGDLVVTLFDTDGIEYPQTETTDYTVSGKGEEDGGAVTFLAAPSNGWTVLIQRVLPETQPTDLKNQGSFYPRTIERMFDRVTFLIQQVKEETGRTIKLPPQVEGVSTTLPVPEPNTIFGWDAEGDSITNFPLSTIASNIAYGDKQFQTFAGTGAQVNFILAQDPASLGNLDISIDGVTQVPGTDYTYAGTTLTFTTAPANGAVILVRYDIAVPVGSAVSSAVQYTPPQTGIVGTVKSFLDSLWTAGANSGAALIRFLQGGTSAVARTAQDKMRERISVKDFGAVGDGVTDDTAAIQAAITYVESITTANTFATNACLFFPHGCYVINDTLTIRRPIAVLGEGIGDIPTNNAPGTGRAMTMLYAGAGVTDKPMVRVISANAGEVLIHGTFERIQINGNGLASYGFYGSSLSRWKLDVSEYRCRLAGMRLDDANGTLNSFNEIRNSYVAGVDASTAGSHGLWIIGTQGTSAGNPQQRIFMASASTVNGDNLRFESDVDNAIVYYATGSVTGTGRNLALVNGVSTPRVNFFLYWAGGKAFFDSNTFANVIYATSSETTTITGTGKYHLMGIVDYATGGMWRTNNYLLTDELVFCPSDFQVSASGVGATVANLASFLPCWTLDPAGGEVIATSRRLPQHWCNARITQARINFSFDADPGAGTSVVFRVHLQVASPQAGQLVGVPVTKDLTFALPSNNIRRNFEAVITLDSPLTVPNDAMIVFAIQRLGSSGADTAATDVYVTGAGLAMQSLGPTSAGSGTITIPSMGN